MTTILATDFWTSIMPNVVANKDVFIQSTWETIYMTLVSGIIAGILGIIIGIALVVTAPGGILANRTTYWILDKLVNIFRSIPFIILLAVIAPFTRLLVGTSIGTTAALVPLTIGTAPFYARQVQNALVDVDRGIIEAAEAVGASPMQIIFRVYLREALPDLIRTSVVTVISLIGLTAMAGAIGGGGLGNTAISIGYDRFENDITIMAMIIILAIVFIIQILGDLWARKTDHR
ncbi:MULTISPECIES: methionine ABC transporter permease [Furfurilactobacillus]|uniref:ABC-type metal ion transport system, permease component n=3 Tax=Furfurilactobacillus TaxID=2767882 RepID=A0A0R1RI59_9LACO|nr:MULTISPECIES: methionine ABC transporter permease [Furfurilactobacillus]KRL56209.1 ABC-type metal ion transport system, permease component [Furfurilactobacillus rossiae DSM 15814]QLE61668.1 Methionine ABC transporter permease protein [Furfurilactobacillus rossiae]QLE64472.1 Methionine ABC transporter permease protein [Furfurilactobacillus rossiae]